MNEMLQSTRRARLLGSLVLAAMFAAGGVAGVALDRAVAPTEASAEEADAGDRRRDEDDDDDDDRRDRRVSLLDRLELTEAQRRDIDSIRSRWHRQVDAFWDTAGPRLRSIADSARTEIRAVLTTPQRARYDSLREAHRRERREKKDDDDDRSNE